MSAPLTKLAAARLLIASLTDADKWRLLGEQLEGDLCFDDEAAVDALGPVTDAYCSSYEEIDELIDATMFDPSDDYDGGRFDFETSRGLAA